MQAKPAAEDIRTATQAKPEHHAATANLRESWSVINPRGREIHYPTHADALTAARTGIY